MDRRGWMILRVLINRYNPKAGNALLKHLPEEEKQEVLAQSIESTDLIPLLIQPKKALTQMHYSWIRPLLNHFSEHFYPAVAAALNPAHIRGLKLGPPIEISEPVKNFILHHLYQFSKAHEHLPIEYLPESEFSPLADWSKAKLVHLIDFLGLYDLASDVRHIVNRNYLKNIYTCLTPKQFHYLKVCLHQKERIISPKLGIDPSKQDCVKLKQVIHKRGLIRLGRALCGQHPDLIWHIAHRLDTGRGKILLKDYRSEALPKITPVLRQQVLNVMNFLKSE